MSKGTLRLIDIRTNGVVEFEDVDDYRITPTGRIVVWKNDQPITLMGEYKLPASHIAQVMHANKPTPRSCAHLGAVGE